MPCVSVPNAIRSRSKSWRAANLRIVRHGPMSESGWMTTFTREPSGRRAST